MTNLEIFTKDLGNFLMMEQEDRMVYLKKCYQNYLLQAAQLNYLREDIVENLKRLISFVICSDGVIDKKECEIIQEAIYETKSLEEIKKMCMQYNSAHDLEQLFIYARRMFEEFGSNSYLYMIGVILITSDDDVSDDELKKFSQLFGINR